MLIPTGQPLVSCSRSFSLALTRWKANWLAGWKDATGMGSGNWNRSGSEVS